MPDTTVMVVDDSAVNLKLADILLRKEGFIVHTSESAEDALRVLRGVRPDLILVDIQLPGMDGLELTRRIKQDPRLEGIMVIALTASNTQAHRDRATAAGCSGYITKPIDTRTFAAQVREQLHGVAPPAPQGAQPMLPGGLSFTSVEIESLRRRFLEEGLLQSRQMLADMGRALDQVKAKQLLHRWIGSGGALGYTDISALSRQGEDELNLPAPNMERLRGTLCDLTYAFQDPREAAMSPMPEFITKELAGQRIGLVDFGAEEAERLCSVLESFGARPFLFLLADRTLSETLGICNVILVHVGVDGAAASWLALHAPESEAPVVLVGERDAILALDPAIQARASEFLIDGWQPEEALMRLKYAISRLNRSRARKVAPPTPPAGSGGAWRVLIADDDEITVTLLQNALEAQGMHCWTASTGLEAEVLISNCYLHAAVIDVNMPGKNGFDLLASIRDAGSQVRVLLLTAFGGESNVVRGFTLGADDYVVKPVSPAEVAVRLKRLLPGSGPGGVSPAKELVQAR